MRGWVGREPILGHDRHAFVSDLVNTRKRFPTRIGSGWWAGVPREGAAQKTKSSIPPDTYSSTPVM